MPNALKQSIPGAGPVDGVPNKTQQLQWHEQLSGASYSMLQLQHAYSYSMQQLQYATTAVCYS